MSADDIQQIIRRSVIDRAFAKSLRDNFEEAVAEYDLAPIEKAALKAMQVEFDVKTSKRPRRKARARRAKRQKRSSVPSFYQLD